MLREFWGNPSSAYAFGSQVHGYVEKAREAVAALINADPKEIVFTTCGTESNNSAIHSALVTNPAKKHVITTAVEHSANINFGEYLRKQGYEVTFLPVESDGSLDVHLAGKIHSARHRHRFHHVGQQRNRRPFSDRGNRGHLP